MSATPGPGMTSNRPYLLRALYDWITDNDLTPYLLVDARVSGTRVPPSAVRDGQVVLNIAMRAVAELELGNERIRFHARFGGVSHTVDVPVGAVLAIYAQENGQGMMFPAESDPIADSAAATPVAASKPTNAPSLSAVPTQDPDGGADKPPPKKGPTLRVVK